MATGGDKLVPIPFGDGALALRVPRGACVLRSRPVRAVASPGKAVQDALARPVGAPPLDEVVRRKGARSAVVVLSDGTRPVPYRAVLPPLLSALEAAGVARRRILLLVATGLHRPMTRAEQIACYGKRIVDRYRIVNHTAANLRSVADTGKRSPSGARLYVNRHYLRADLRVLTGLVEPHFMAGYSGGRKAIVPGLVNLEAVRQFHGFRLLDHPRAANGVVVGNPVHEESLGSARAVGADFVLNVTITPGRRVAGVFAGDLEAAWEAGVAELRGRASIRADRQFDLVVTSAGGAPLDRTFYQAVKGMVAPLPLLHGRSHLLLASRCAEGIGGREYRDLMFEYSGRLKRFIRDIRRARRVRKDQWELQMQVKVLDRIGVERLHFFCTGIPRAEQERLSVTPCDSAGRSAARAFQSAFDALAGGIAPSRIAVLPEGPYVVVEQSPVR